MDNKNSYNYRSLFWPIILIGVGVLWLLSNFDMIGDFSWWSLWRLWPLILIGIGLDILIGRRHPLLGAAVGLLLVGLAIAVIVFFPDALQSSGLFGRSNVEIVQEQFTADLGQAEAGSIDLNFSIGETHVFTLEDSPYLLAADLSHFGEIDFRVSEGDTTTVHLSQAETDLGPYLNVNGRDVRWEIGLTPTIPLALELKGGVGESTINLEGTTLSAFEMEVGVGDVELTLPALPEDTQTQIQGGVGTVDLRLVDGGPVNLHIKGGVGKFNIYVEQDIYGRIVLDGGVGEFILDLPDGIAVRLEGQSDIGDIRVPSWLDLVSGSDSQGLGTDGVWESENYEDAEQSLLIIFDGDIGNLIIR
ncbi:MAG: DUF5668 domain-containing protein [Anaerolineales bacterium]|jgi:hypothetical protein